MEFNKEDYTTNEAIEQRIKELEAVVTRDGATASEIDAATEELRLLNERAEELNDIAEKRAAVKEIANGTRSVMTVEKGTAMENNERIFTVESEEYRSAWLKKMAVRDGTPLLGDLTDVEERAFVYTTANSGALVPTVTLNRIIDRVKAEFPMLEDAEISAITEGFAIPVRKSIKAGDADVVAEGTANDDEEDEFDLIAMPGVDINKHATMTRRMKFQSIDAFETWLVNDISKRIGVAKERVLIARLDGAAPKAGVATNDDVAIDSGNILTDLPYSDESIRQIMAKIDENGQVVVYANRSTIYNGFAGITRKDGKPAFIESTMVDPTVKGVMYGAAVKVDANLADDVAYFGVQGSLKGNEFVPLEIFPTVEAKTANTIFTGTETFDGGLENPKAFVKATFTDEESE